MSFLMYPKQRVTHAPSHPLPCGPQAVLTSWSRELTWRPSPPSMTNSASCQFLSPINSMDSRYRNSYRSHARTLSATSQASLSKCTAVIGGSLEATQTLPGMDTQLELHNSLGTRLFFRSDLRPLPLISTRLQIRRHGLKPSEIGITANLRHLGTS